MYQKPVCQCGSELVVAQDFYYREQFKINEDGLRSTKKIRKTEDDKYIIEEYLRCPKCTSRFESDCDIDGRIVVVGEIHGHLSGSDNINIVKSK